MTSSSFQTSRLKTVSKRPLCFSVFVCMLLFICVNICGVFSSCLDWCVGTWGECLCVFSCLCTLTFAQSRALWGAAAVLWVFKQVHGWGVGCGGVSLFFSFSLCLYLSLPSLCCPCTSRHRWDIIALWFICINIRILWQILPGVEVIFLTSGRTNSYQDDCSDFF